MKIDIDALNRFHDSGTLIREKFGDARETACLMSALTGGTNFKQCESAGWPRWLAELGALLFDQSPGGVSAWQFATEFSAAVRDADARKVDWHRVFCAIRKDSILPIAREAIGDGDEPWRIACRDAVDSVLRTGEVAETARATRATRAAATAAAAAGATWAAAYARITESTIRCIQDAGLGEESCLV